jgi:hypothetical protein
MAPNIAAKTEWPVTGAAYWGGVLGAMAVMVHEVYTGISGHCPEVDPFTHVMAELAVFAPAGAVMLGVAANVRTWLVRRKHSPSPPQDNSDELPARARPALQVTPRPL